MFDWLFDGIAGLLSLYFDLTGSIGGSIIALTLTLMIVTFPLTLKSSRSMMQMQRLQPEMKRLQTKYKDDRQQLNEELMKFYQEHQINPLSGCLPLLLQMPIFFVLFAVLRGLSNVDDGVPDPKYLDHASALYDKIFNAGGELISWGFDLGEAATSGHSSFVAALPYYLLIAMVAGTAYVQQKQMMGRRDPNQPVNPQQQMMQRIMVIFLPLISLNIPAGVVVYFVVSNLFRIGQQSLIHRMDLLEKDGGSAKEAAGEGRGRPWTSGRGSKDDQAVVEAEVVEDAGPTPEREHPRSKKKKKRKRR